MLLLQIAVRCNTKSAREEDFPDLQVSLPKHLKAAQRVIERSTFSSYGKWSQADPLRFAMRVTMESSGSNAWSSRQAQLIQMHGYGYDQDVHEHRN